MVLLNHLTSDESPKGRTFLYWYQLFLLIPIKPTAINWNDNDLDIYRHLEVQWLFKYSTPVSILIFIGIDFRGEAWARAPKNREPPMHLSVFYHIFLPKFGFSPNIFTSLHQCSSSVKHEQGALNNMLSFGK